MPILGDTLKMYICFCIICCWNFRELEEQKAISDNFIEELELDKLELIEEWNLHKEKSAEEYNAKMEEMEAEIDLLSSEVETLTMRNQELQQSLDKKKVRL